MGRSFEQYQKQKLISSYFSVVVSIALVLFLLGMLGLLVLNTKKMADHFKEQITVSIFLKDEAKESEIDQLQKTLAMAEHTKSTTYVSKEEAAEQHSAEIGEDFQDFLGYNPLKNSIDLQLQADFVTPEEIEKIADDLSKKAFVEEVSYDKPLVGLLTENVKKISFWILVASGILTFIAFLLINSSIRLSIYSKRFIIKTMQMVGATKTFIRNRLYGQTSNSVCWVPSSPSWPLLRLFIIWTGPFPNSCFLRISRCSPCYLEVSFYWAFLYRLFAPISPLSGF